MWPLAPNIQKLEEKNDFWSLLSALKHKKDSIRAKAIEAISRVDLGKGLEFILPLTKDDSSEEVKEAALKAATDNKYMLLGFLKNKNSNLRFYAVYAMTNVVDDMYKPGLIEALKDTHDVVRQHVVIALAKYPDNEVAEKLVEIARKDPHPVVQLTAAGQLKGMIDKLSDENIKKAVEMAFQDLEKQKNT